MSSGVCLIYSQSSHGAPHRPHLIILSLQRQELAAPIGARPLAAAHKVSRTYQVLVPYLLATMATR